MMYQLISLEKVELFLGGDGPLHHGLLDVLVDGLADLVLVVDDLLHLLVLLDPPLGRS
jgi:hypothetical protein